MNELRSETASCGLTGCELKTFTRALMTAGTFESLMMMYPAASDRWRRTASTGASSKCMLIRVVGPVVARVVGSVVPGAAGAESPTPAAGAAGAGGAGAAGAGAAGTPGAAGAAGVAPGTAGAAGAAGPPGAGWAAGGDGWTVGATWAGTSDAVAAMTAKPRTRAHLSKPRMVQPFVTARIARRVDDRAAPVTPGDRSRRPQPPGLAYDRRQRNRNRAGSRARGRDFHTTGVGRG